MLDVAAYISLPTWVSERRARAILLQTQLNCNTLEVALVPKETN